MSRSDEPRSPAVHGWGGVTTYKFKYSNYDLKRYVDNRKAVAIMKRREAELLRLHADTIDGEMMELELTLLPVEET